MPAQVIQRTNIKDVHSHTNNEGCYEINPFNEWQEYEFIINYHKDKEQLISSVNIESKKRRFIVNTLVFQDLFYQFTNRFNKIDNKTYNNILK
jgi:hypothetical protein